MVRYRFSVGFALCIFLLYSCSLEKGEKEPLQQIEEIIDIHPDSALHLLKEIKNPEKLSKKNRAKYALLFTKAQDKNYIKHTSDSLINIAVDYYSKEKDNKYKAEAYFYLGSVHRDMDYSSTSIEAFLKALEIIPKNNEDRLIMLTYNSLAQQYEIQAFYDKAIEMARKAYEYCITKEQKNDLYHVQRRMSKLFLLKNKPDSALHYANQALEIAELKKDSFWESMVLCDISRIYNEKKDFETAHHFINKAIEKRQNNLPSSILFLKGVILAELGEVDSASIYLFQSTKSNDIKFKAATFQRLYKIEKDKGEYKKAIGFNEDYIIFRDSVYSQQKRFEISALINEHALNIRMKDHFIKQQKQEFVILILSLTVFGLILFLLLILKKRKKERIIFLQRELMRNRVSTLKLNQENKGESNEPQISPKTDLSSFKKKLEICINLFKTNESYDIIRKIQKTKGKEKKLSSEDRERLKESFYESFIDIIEDLETLFNKLTEADIYCCILYLLNCENIEVAVCMGVLPDTLKVRRSRIKSKISEEFYNFIFKD